MGTEPGGTALEKEKNTKKGGGVRDAGSCNERVDLMEKHD